ncbi:SRPBCC family protein [Yimella sp. cx-51]|uniref:SRPBCC family protein n=1 Tax=Yimella sp. cx-51 TaxID=2770551 RepID=UPI00165E44EF|nr:SRPBCC family protein [Yimella sp. cx-51]MBC9957605.1 SRPBCC family protein [Yimella sp. cx-51]MBD2758647.1 SRPBCC family protein [Yimella sp. cx-573]QTH37035.1 SRPBCC family protein [Yimella sp. cx-51]
MADSTQSSTEIAADPATVLDIIADFDSYPEWATQVKRATVLEEDELGWPVQVEFVLDAAPIRDTYVLEYDWDVTEEGTGAVRWHLVKSDLLKALDGVYDLTPVQDGVKVAYSLSVDLKLPVLGVIRRKAERTIIDTALDGLKKRAEG